MASGKQNAIFIGYRREDTQDTAGRIYDRLVSAFGEKAVFKDVDNLPIGADFGAHILGLLPRCRVFLALIGPGWLDARDETGARRLDDPGDWVRIELETAFATPGLQIVPVLVNGARMPRGDELPESLRRLTRFNAASVRRDPDFSTDMARMVEALRASVTSGVLDLASLGGKAEPTRSAATRPERNRSGLMFAGGIAAALTLVALGYGAWRFLGPPESSPASSEQTDQSTTVAEESAAPAARPPAQQPSAAPPTQSAPPVQARVEEPVRAPPPSAGALPEMVRIPEQSFEVGRYEVTFAQWDACVAAGGCDDSGPRAAGGDNGWGRGNRPVIEVSWDDAQSYVRWLSQRTGQRYRLLTSAEWEIAARAGTTTNYSWGDQNPVCDQNARNGANFDACTDDRTRPVGSFQPNAFGLYDMHGNVWEWVEDCYDASCSSRVLRGGSWGITPGGLRSASRVRGTPSNRGISVGFRVARTL